MAAKKRLLAVNADDFGFTRDVNRGIVDAHRNGILTSTTLMANGDAFEDAARLSFETPTLDVGVHFVLVGGRSVASPGRELPATVAALIRQVASGRIDIGPELRAQIEKILSAGIRVTHLDTHKHTHLLPPVLEAVAKLGEEFGVPWVRRPMDLPMHGAPAGTPWKIRLASQAMSSLRARFHRVLEGHGCRTTDWFAGFQMTGRYDATEVVRLLANLQPGTTEFMTHPGYCGEELMASRTRLKSSREAELRALTDARVREAVEREGILLAPYHQF